MSLPSSSRRRLLSDYCRKSESSGMVRHKLYMAILNIIRHKQGPIYNYYARLAESGKPKLVAIAAAMRKLLAIIYAMLKTQTPFDPNKHEQSKQKN